MKTIKAITVVVLVLMVVGTLVATVGCGTNSTTSTSGVTASINTGGIHDDVYFYTSVLVVPVVVTPKAVPSNDVSYAVELVSREEYSYGMYYVSWSRGEAPTAKEVDFTIFSDEASASHVYLQLHADLQSSNLVTLKADATALLKVEITKQ